MQPRLTFLVCCLAGCAATLALMLLVPHYSGMARVLLAFYTVAGSVVAVRLAIRPT